ncbi:MAG: flavodoxin-dependent (E)-4-hydroxy-3-methylbut-2-enyl-diphosphate synthase [Bacillota bacterium]
MGSQKSVVVRGVRIGGDNPVVVQGMAKTPTDDIEATLRQIAAIHGAGAQIVRVALPNRSTVGALKAIRERTDVPLVADVHFDPDLAVEAIRAGVDKVRVNPGNIGGKGAMEKVIAAASRFGVPIRLGINSGSLERSVLERHGGPTAEAMVESCQEWIKFIEDLGFDNLVVSLKSSSVADTVKAYRLAASRIPYPLHVGVTEAGAGRAGVVKSAVGIGALLLEGIGDTVRVSLTGDPVEEVRVAYEILRACGQPVPGVEIISCPTCGRCHVNLPAIVAEVERRLAHVKRPLRVAVMGCAVNGPGEARHADVGIACGVGRAVLFARGREVAVVPEEEAAKALAELAEELGEG